MEYLAPGVFIEETSFRSKSIEGVSTSTAGFVGRAKDGPAGTPVLVTSFAEFQRIFGSPYSAPTDPSEYLGFAVRGFFDNGGRRAWIVRVLGAGSSASRGQATHGVVLGVRQTVPEQQTVLPVTSLRGIDATSTLEIFWRESSAVLSFQSITRAVSSYDTVRGTVELATATDAGAILRPGNSYILVQGIPPQSGPEVDRGPTFTARNHGEAGNSLAVQLVPADRPPVRIVGNVSGGAPDPDNRTVPVASVSGFYTGAIVEIDSGTSRQYGEVEAIDPDLRRIRLVDAVSGDITVPDPVTSTSFIRVLESNVNILRGTAIVESFSGLSWNPRSGVASEARYYVNVINDATRGSRLVTVELTVGAEARASHAPTTADGLPLFLGNVAPGSGGAPPTPTELVGQDLGPENRTGIQALLERNDISMVAVPGVTDEFVQSELIRHCEQDPYRIAVLDGLPNTHTVPAIEAHRNAYDSKYGAYYAPWLRTIDLATGNELVVPPSGHVMGIYARTDNQRGVHKAPANEVVRGIIDVELRFTTGEQEVLNPKGVNLIRELEGRGIRVWGARTISSDSEWKYVNVRRYFIYLEASIDRSTQWVVFEPNGESLWARVRQTVEGFLRAEWRAGRLMGTKPGEAFFVRCDRTTMTQNDIDNGRLICEIGVAPLFPAEFVIFRIGQFTASAEL